MKLFQFTFDSNDVINEAIVGLHDDYERDPWRMPHEPRLCAYKAEFVYATAIWKVANVFAFPEFDGVLKLGEISILTDVTILTCTRAMKNATDTFWWDIPEGLTGKVALVYVPNWQANAGAVHLTVNADTLPVGRFDVGKVHTFSEANEPVDFFNLTAEPADATLVA